MSSSSSSRTTTHKAPRALAYSAKQKREQLRQKRNRQREQLPLLDRAHHSPGDKEAQSFAYAPSNEYDQDQHAYLERHPHNKDHHYRCRRKSDQDPSVSEHAAVNDKTDLDSVFTKIPRALVAARRQESQTPFTRLPKAALQVDLQTLYPPTKPPPDIPKRPHWSYDETKQNLDKQEHAAFAQWLTKLNQEYPNGQLSWYEQNLQVWRQLWRVVEISDIIMCLVDSRHPVLQFPPRLYEWVVKELGKEFILVLNKADLVDAKTIQAWSEYFKELYPDVVIVAFSCCETRVSARGRLIRSPRVHGIVNILQACRNLNISKPGVEKINWDALIGRAVERAAEQEALDRMKETRREGRGAQDSFLGRSRRRQNLDAQGDESMGDVAKDRKTKSTKGKRKKGADAAIHGDGSDQDHHLPPRHIEANAEELTIGLIGHPNVGKSSLLNEMLGKKVVSVSRTAGHTKHFQTIYMGPNLRLADCPGLVFPSLLPKSLQILSGMYKIAQVQEPYSAIHYLAERIPLERILKLNPPADSNSLHYQWSVWDICEQYALKCGYLIARSAEPDVYRAANAILSMACDGVILLSLKPPGFYSDTDDDDDDHHHSDGSEVEDGAVSSDGAEEDGSDAEDKSEERESVDE
ncbi:hypothetical protein SeMB42_g05482 [Synchytrium endobioticum]|uniref:Guanine nucleotide-binding protein-like 1 n=1 Tax=Synchytrium endobioticum TaxID=286115 RepID=A0A507DCM9_9FUNG|nr:hypothetical protein SeMB42_g05482 [Synchytrium endobioticum]TPX49313.1 hypothetical protein SeLEV6574_g01548 [Synchytrium endobioticum]